IRTRMARLRRQIAAMAPARETKRASRQRNRVPAVAIAGYTNAGKSSLLNRLTGAGVLVENALFATLDPTVRRAETPDGRVYTLADTVGFVRNLPHELVEAFRSTLEEVAEADVILHVVDASHPDPEGQLRAVREVLADIPGTEEIPELVVQIGAGPRPPTGGSTPSPTPSASSATCPTSSSRRSAPRWRRSPRPTSSSTSSTPPTPTPRARCGRCARCSPTSRAPRRSLSSSC